MQQVGLSLHHQAQANASAPDYRYRGFREDILNFYHLLQLLERSLKDAQRRYRDGGLFAANEGAHDPMAEDFEAERIIIVGNFKDTLRDCEALLNENKQFRVRYSTVVENLKWYVTHPSLMRSLC
jgi:hypothetical protein